MSNKKHSRSIQYLNHSQNTSPGKTAFSFSKSSRFPNLNSYNFIFTAVRHLISFIICQLKDPEELLLLGLVKNFR